METQENSVGVFICSRGRSSGLAELASAVASQKVPPGWTFHSLNFVWNTDTEPDPFPPRVLGSSGGRGPTIREFLEPKIGIPFARNRALEIAQGDKVSHIVFIDDDCIPHADWLEVLLGVIDQTNAEVVAGGWRITPKEEPSSWLPRKVFGRKHYYFAGRNAANLEHLPTAYTRNVVFSARFLDTVPEEHMRFPESMASTGGSDTVFFARAHLDGARIVYAPYAKVEETYVDSRLTLRWHFLRRIRNTQVRLTRRKETREPLAHPPAILVALVFAILALPAAFVLLPLSLLSTRMRRAVGAVLLQIAPLFGVVLWGLGVEYQEYARRFGFRSRNTIV